MEALLHTSVDFFPKHAGNLIRDSSKAAGISSLISRSAFASTDGVESLSKCCRGHFPRTAGFRLLKTFSQFSEGSWTPRPSAHTSPASYSQARNGQRNLRHAHFPALPKSSTDGSSQSDDERSITVSDPGVGGRGIVLEEDENDETSSDSATNGGAKSRQSGGRERGFFSASSIDAEDRSEAKAGGSSAGGGSKGILNASSTFLYSNEATALGAKEPVYQVLEVTGGGQVLRKEVSRRQLLKSSGLRQRDVRRVDPSLWVTNSLPALLVRDNAILLNLGSLRAIASSSSVLIFDHASVGAKAFLGALMQRLQIESDPSSPAMPFELEVLESALTSRTLRLEQALMDVEPRVLSLLETLPVRLTADALEELRISKQALVELGAKAGALRQMLLELLEDHAALRRMTAMGRQCRVSRVDGNLECDLPQEKLLAEEEEQEVEMLLEYYLQRCDSCHGQAEKLLDSAKEMEDSISVNLSSRRLEVSRLELLLQVGTFAVALGALIAGIFGMNLRSYLEEHVGAFYFTTLGIILGGVLLVVAVYAYLKRRRIL